MPYNPILRGEQSSQSFKDVCCVALELLPLLPVSTASVRAVTRGTPWHHMHEKAGKDVRVVAGDIECDGRDGAFLSIHKAKLAVFSTLLVKNVMVLKWYGLY